MKNLSARLFLVYEALFGTLAEDLQKAYNYLDPIPLSCHADLLEKTQANGFLEQTHPDAQREWIQNEFIDLMATKLGSAEADKSLARRRLEKYFQS